MSFSNPNSGVWAPITSSPSSLYSSCNALMCGCAFWQLKQLYVQNSTSTTFSPASFIDTPSVLIRPVQPVISLAREYLSSLLAIRSASETACSCFSPVSRSGGPDLSVSSEEPETTVSPLTFPLLCGPTFGCLSTFACTPAASAPEASSRSSI